MATHTSPIICTVDVVLLTLNDSGQLCVASFLRDKEPYKGSYALPGGYVRPDEDATAFYAAMRVLRDKTGIESPYLEQLATFSGANRDPRGWSASIVYFALVPKELLDKQNVADMRLTPIHEVGRMPFDHADIVQCAVNRVRSKSLYTTLPALFLGEFFTLPQLQASYEAVMGKELNKVSFRRKMATLEAIESVGVHKLGRQNRPPEYFRLRPEWRTRLEVFDRGVGVQ